MPNDLLRHAISPLAIPAAESQSSIAYLTQSGNGSAPNVTSLANEIDNPCAQKSGISGPYASRRTQASRTLMFWLD